MSELYEKHISPAGRISYRPVTIQGAGIVEMDNKLLGTMVATFVVGVIEAAWTQIPNHTRQSRELAKLQEAVINYAKVTASPLDETMLNAMVCGWNAGMKEIQRHLQ